MVYLATTAKRIELARPASYPQDRPLRSCSNVSIAFISCRSHMVHFCGKEIQHCPTQLGIFLRGTEAIYITYTWRFDVAVNHPFPVRITYSAALHLFYRCILRDICDGSREFASSRYLRDSSTLHAPSSQLDGRDELSRCYLFSGFTVSE